MPLLFLFSLIPVVAILVGFLLRHPVLKMACSFIGTLALVAVWFQTNFRVANGRGINASEASGVGEHVVSLLTVQPYFLEAYALVCTVGLLLLGSQIIKAVRSSNQ